MGKVFLSQRMSLILMLCSIALFLRAADKKYDVEFYNRWALLPIDSLMKMGEDFSKREKADSALLCYTIVANQYYERKLRKEEVPQVVKALSLAGYYYHFVFFDYQKSFNNLTLALELSEKYRYRAQLPYIYRELAGIYLTNNDVHQYANETNTPLEYYKKGFYAAMENKDYPSAVSNFINIINMADDEVSFRELHQEIQAFRSIPKKDVKLYRYSLLLCEGLEAYFSKDYAAALKAFSEMEQNIQSSGEESRRRYLQQVYSMLSRTHFMNGDDAQGVDYLHRMEQMAQEHQMVDVLVDVYRVLQHYYADHDDKPRAQHYELLYLQMKDSIMTNNKLENVNHARFIHQLDRVNEQVKQLAAERSLRDYIIIGIAAFALMLIGIIVYIVRNNRAIYHKNRTIYLQSVALLEAEKEEHQKTAHRLTKSQEQLMRTKRELQHAEYRLQEASRIDSNSLRKESPLSDEEQAAIYEKILQVMGDTELVCTNGFSVQKLAEAVGESPRKVSETINNRYGDNFPSLVSEYRIKEACRLINTPDFFSMHSMTGVAERVGIKSRTQFSNIFKRFVGMSPSAYAKQMKEAMSSK